MMKVEEAGTLVCSCLLAWLNLSCCIPCSFFFGGHEFFVFFGWRFFAGMTALFSMSDLAFFFPAVGRFCWWYRKKEYHEPASQLYLEVLLPPCHRDMLCCWAGLWSHMNILRYKAISRNRKNEKISTLMYDHSITLACLELWRKSFRTPLESRCRRIIDVHVICVDKSRLVNIQPCLYHLFLDQNQKNVSSNVQG